MRLETRVCGVTISTVKIVNMTELPGNDEINTYDWTYYRENGDVLIGKVRHRYGDGHMRLVSKVTDQIAQKEAAAQQDSGKRRKKVSRA
jgi:hypothetical protein